MISRNVSSVLAAIVLTLAACDSSDDKAKEASKSAAAAAPKAPVDAKVFFVEPKDGAVVKGPAVDGKVKVEVTMGVEGIEVKPAGTMDEGTGHHHIVVDGKPIEAGVVVPADETHIHYGGGQTEAELELAPGEHTLTMQFANGAHVSYGEALSATVEITVSAES